MTNHDRRDTLEDSLILCGEITPEIVTPIMNKLLAINDERRNLANTYTQYEMTPVDLFIITNGGNPYIGFGLIGIMETSIVPINTIAAGAVMSMGLPIFAAGHHRIAHRHATFMYHEVSTHSVGKIEEQRIEMEESKRLMNVFDDFLIERSKLTKVKLDKIKEQRKDWYFTAKEAMEFGLVDEIIDGPVIKKREVNEQI